VNLKDFRPALSGSGGLGEKRRPQIFVHGTFERSNWFAQLKELCANRANLPKPPVTISPGKLEIWSEYPMEAISFPQKFIN
jgi:hypothetical protein